MSVTPIQQFESQLEQLECAARRGDALSQLLLMARECLKTLTPAAEIVVRVTEKAQIRLQTGTCDLLTDILLPTGTSDDNGDGDSKSNSDNSLRVLRRIGGEAGLTDGWTIQCCRVLSGTHRIQFGFAVTQDPAQHTVLSDAAGTLADVLAEAATRRLLSDLSERVQHMERTQVFVQRLARTTTAEQWAQEVAQRGVEYLGRGRISVLSSVPGGVAGAWTLLAATGSISINPASEAVRRNEKVATLLSAESETAGWLSTEHSSAEEQGELAQFFAQYAALGVSRIRLEKISGNDGSVVYGLLMELFETSQMPPESLARMVCHEISEAARLLPRPSYGRTWHIVGTPARRLMVFTCLMLLVLMFIPAEFEIEVSGQAFPVSRHRIFAPDDGIVEDLLVMADQPVQKAQTLLRLRNPERELEQSRIMGEVESAVSRLQAIRATRSSSASPSATNAAGRQSDLSSEEQQLEQKLSSLKQELSLVEEQIASLNVTAPASGVVYQRHLQEQLRARPVQRGQLLMEVVDADGEWEMVLQIPDDVIGYVQARSGKRNVNENTSVENNADVISAGEDRSDDSMHTVRYSLTSEPGKTRTTHLVTLEQASHLQEDRLTCLATAMIAKDAVANLRPGQSVSARIACGRRSLAFVWFREVIEFWQRKKFAWL